MPIVRAGAMVDDAARPGIDDEEHHRLFMLLVARGDGVTQCATTISPRQQEIAATLTENDMKRTPRRRGGARRDVVAPGLGATPTKRVQNCDTLGTNSSGAFDVLLTPVGGDGRFPAQPRPQSR